MVFQEQDWVSLHEAASTVGVPVTTIRDWFRTGLVDSKLSAEGHRLVVLSQVYDHATGASRDGRGEEKPGLRRTAEQLDADAARETELSRAVVELQSVARGRLEPDA